MAQARSFVERLAVAGLLALGLTAFAAPQAMAQNTAQQGGWEICNQTSFVLEAATGRPEGRNTLMQGWLRLRPGECRVAVQAPLARGAYYLFARSSTAHRGGRRQWGGPVRLCIDPSQSFALENSPRCTALGLEQRGFREVRINKRDRFRTNLSEPEPYSLARARAAGLQRLLNDAGVDTRGASRDPRRVAAAIAQFRTQARLPANASEDQLVDALEAAARRRADGMGLLLCNRAAEPVWAAIARRRGEGWESRGWWPLSPGGCARAIDDPLLQGVYFVHAVMTGKQGDRYLSAPGEMFCTSTTRFAVLGRDGCKQRFYDESIFVPVSSQGREGLVVEFSERDFLPPGVQPQRVEVPQIAREDAAARQAEAAAAAGQPRSTRRPLQPNAAAAQQQPGDVVITPDGAQGRPQGNIRTMIPNLGEAPRAAPQQQQQQQRPQR